jgi:hypothetical protein
MTRISDWEGMVVVDLVPNGVKDVSTQKNSRECFKKNQGMAKMVFASS